MHFQVLKISFSFIRGGFFSVHLQIVFIQVFRFQIELNKKEKNILNQVVDESDSEPQEEQGAKVKPEQEENDGADSDFEVLHKNLRN